MGYPADYKYTAEHVWAKAEGDVVKLGITEYAAEQLGDVLFVDLPEVGTEFDNGDTFSEVESSKTTSELPTPVAGEVVAINEELDDSPELLNDDPYGAWIVAIRTEDDIDGLMSAADYESDLD